MGGKRFYTGLLNIMIMVPGIILIVMGILSMNDPYFMMNYLKILGGQDTISMADVLHRSRYLFLLVGILIVTPPTISIIGLYFYSKLFMCLYGIIMFVSVVMLLSILVFGMMSPSNSGPHLMFYLQKSLKYYRGDEHLLPDLNPLDESVTLFWNVVQVKLRCCGLRNYTDYFDTKSMKWYGQEMGVPKTCCKKLSNSYLARFDYMGLDRCRTPYLDAAMMNLEPCYKSINKFLTRVRHLIMIITLSLIVVQLFMLCVIFAMVIPSDKPFLEMLNRF